MLRAIAGECWFWPMSATTPVVDNDTTFLLQCLQDMMNWHYKSVIIRFATTHPHAAVVRPSTAR
jgi:hypothetical protein